MRPIRIDEHVLAAIKRQDKATRLRVGQAIADAQSSFGAPHVHSGADIRKLKGRWYEIRAGLSVRLVFKDRGDCLSCELMGNRDDVRRFLKGAK